MLPLSLVGRDDANVFVTSSSRFGRRSDSILIDDDRRGEFVRSLAIRRTSPPPAKLSRFVVVAAIFFRSTIGIVVVRR